MIQSYISNDRSFMSHGKGGKIEKSKISLRSQFLFDFEVHKLSHIPIEKFELSQMEFERISSLILATASNR